MRPGYTLRGSDRDLDVWRRERIGASERGWTEIAGVVALGNPRTQGWGYMGQALTPPTYPVLAQLSNDKHVPQSSAWGSALSQDHLIAPVTVTICHQPSISLLYSPISSTADLYTLHYKGLTSASIKDTVSVCWWIFSWVLLWTLKAIFQGKQMLVISF